MEPTAPESAEPLRREGDLEPLVRAGVVERVVIQTSRRRAIRLLDGALDKVAGLLVQQC